MLKYVDVAVTFSEVPDEISLCIDISNCPCHCKGCHSSYLAKDIGEVLDNNSLEELILKNKGISCVCLMGGDANPALINVLASHIKYNERILNECGTLKVAWYSGRQKLSNHINLANFDYIKLGPYKEEKGPLNNPNTNQKFFKVNRLSKLPPRFSLENITYKFWKKEI